MFDGMFSKGDTKLRQWLLPLLSAEDVSQATLGAIRSGKEFCVVPWHFEWLIPLFRLLPLGLYDIMAGLAGAHTGMSGFTGRCPRVKSDAESAAKSAQHAVDAHTHLTSGAHTSAIRVASSPSQRGRSRRRSSGRSAPVQRGGGDGIYTSL